MLLTPHTLVGIAIGAIVKEPLVAVPVSFFMHFMGDLVPHWDFYTGTTTEEQRSGGWKQIGIMADLSIGVGTGVFFSLYALWVMGNPNLALTLFLCGIAGVLPDALSAIPIYTKKSPRPLILLYKIQGILQFPAKLPWGLLTQVIVILLTVLLISSSLGL